MNIKQPVTRFIKAVVAVLCIVPALTCCTLIYEWPEAETFKPNVRLYIDVPMTKASMDDSSSAFNPGDEYNHEGADNLLFPNDLSVVFYKPDGSFVSAAAGDENIKVTSDSYDRDNLYHRYIVELRAENLVNNESYRVVVLANRRSDYSVGRLPFAGPAQLAFKRPSASPTHTDEEYLYSQLLLSGTSSSDQYGLGLRDYSRLNLAGADEARVPMWGVEQMTVKVNNEGYGVDFSGTIFLLRSIAKVKVSLSADLQNFVEVTDYSSAVPESGMVLHYRRNSSTMVPGYTYVEGLTSTVNLTEAQYKNTTSDTGTFTAPFYKDTDGAFYIYLPEQEIGDAYMTMQFHYIDLNLQLEPIYVTKTLQFADYMSAAADLLDGKDIPLTDEQLAPYRFPVLRNHYYIYTITKLDPLELKYEVCEWNTKESGTINLGDLTEFNEWNKQHIHYTEGAFTTSYDAAQGTITITARANADIKSGASPTMKIDGYDAAVTRVGDFYEATVTHKFTQDWVADVEWHFPNEDGETYVIRHEHQIERKLTLLSYQDIWDMNQNDGVTKTVMMVNSVSNNASQGYVLGFDGRNAVSPAKSGLAFTSEEVIKNYIQNSGALYDQKYYFRLTREPQGIDLVSYIGGMSPDLKGSESVEWRSGENDHYFHLNQVTTDVANTATPKEYQVRISPKENTSLYLNAQASPSALCYKPGTGNWSVWNFFEVTP